MKRTCTAFLLVIGLATVLFIGGCHSSKSSTAANNNDNDIVATTEFTSVPSSVTQNPVAVYNVTFYDNTGILDDLYVEVDGLSGGGTVGFSKVDDGDPNDDFRTVKITFGQSETDSTTVSNSLMHLGIIKDSGSTTINNP